MNRITEIIDNHETLDQLFSIVEHYGVSAEFVSYALIQQFEQKAKEDEEGADGSNEEDTAYTKELIEDLKLFYTRF